ncbi:MAG: winged helix-turn-helix domain-containing protein [Crocinitomicaceae bacterium]|nr:winged helix-turn-helix domain-containing protein [Crocinitomicaceae bacterium]
MLPIKQENDKFRISFASNFTFQPGALMTSVDSVFEIANIRDSYRLEVEDGDLNEVVYSYESTPVDSSSLVTCVAREYPEANYSVLSTLLDDQGQPIAFTRESEKTDKNSVAQKKSSSDGLLSILISVAILVVIGIYFWRIKNRSKDNSNTIRIGKYRFDQRNMKLLFKKESIDLTSKETDLLTLLHSSIDETIAREKILQVVWGDEGDYVGRTLDVFISKLRKKFSEDTNVKIVNVRGVGYNLMLSEIT